MASAKTNQADPEPPGLVAMRLIDRLLGRLDNRAPHSIFGGITVPAYKARSLTSRLMPVPIAEELVLPLSHNRDIDAVPVVKVGDLVLKFQLLARPGELHGVALHAPTSGLVSSISNATLPGETGSQQLCIHLQTDGDDRAIDVDPIADYRGLSHSQLLERIEFAGIVGLGGSEFHITRKPSLSIRRDIDLLIINAAECEPYVSADQALIRERAKSVVVGAEILQSISLSAHCIIAIENDKEDAIDALIEALGNSPVELMTLTAVYPSGSEKQIIQAVTGMEVPVHQYPGDIGVLVHSVGTAYAAFKAVVCGEPCITRITTLTGAALQTPKNFEALIGTPVSFLFELCGIDTNTHTGSIAGGSLTGISLRNLDVPVTKTSNCLIAMSASEFPAPEPELACIRCGFCAAACPARLLPQQLYAFSRSRDHQQSQDHGLFDCIECGACAYVCPSNIPLLQYYRSSKKEIRELQGSQEKSQHWQSRFQHHQTRIQKRQDKTQNRKIHKTGSLSNGKEPSSGNSGHQKADKTGEAVFSREQAKIEIAEAVARVRARKSSITGSSNTSTESDD